MGKSWPGRWCQAKSIATPKAGGRGEIEELVEADEAACSRPAAGGFKHRCDLEGGRRKGLHKDWPRPRTGC